jgi:cell division protein FtsN
MLRRNIPDMPFVFLVILGWLYVALMMAAAEATHSNGSIAGAIVTFVLYGVLPVGIVGYILLTPARKRAIRAREQAQREASGAPDGSGETPADAVPPVRKEE